MFLEVTYQYTLDSMYHHDERDLYTKARHVRGLERRGLIGVMK
jgi:hypothetical protein